MHPRTDAYRKETLAPLNSRYLAEHVIGERDVAKVNALVSALEDARAAQGDSPAPLDGDLVICELPDGQLHARAAHLETADWLEQGQVTVCVRPYVPFVEPGCHTSASGGPWFIPGTGELRYVGPVPKTFCTWGRFGPHKDGAVEFRAQVNAWKIVAPRHRFV